MTARGTDPARRRDALLWKRARRLSRQTGLPLKTTAKLVRSSDTRLDQLAAGQLTTRELVAGIMAEVRKRTHDTRGAVRS